MDLIDRTELLRLLHNAVKFNDNYPKWVDDVINGMPTQDMPTQIEVTPLHDRFYRYDPEEDDRK